MGTVTILETRPISKTKRWRVVEILARAPQSTRKRNNRNQRADPAPVADNTGAKEIM